jgi:hypothetical protein
VSDWLSDWWVEFVSGIVVLVILLLALSMAVISLRTDAACLKHGWPGSSVTWNFNKYCIKRVNQTDVVISLSDLESK